MSEEAMERAVQQALAREGIDEQVLAAGQFNPRGHTGSMFAGGLAGGEIGGAAGSVGEAVGEVAGVAGGMRANEASSGMPQWMLVGVTAEAVYGFDEDGLHAPTRECRRGSEEAVFGVAHEDVG